MERLISYAGRCEETGDLLFICPSFSDDETVYEIKVNKEDALVTCDCMDAICRKKSWGLFADNPDICKHLRVFRDKCVPFFRDAGIL